MDMKELLIATGNPGKVREFKRLLFSTSLRLLTPNDVGLTLTVDESGDTYLENATLKAVAFATASGLPCLADDSGLEVDALGGRPGLRSARFGGGELDDRGRNALLLRELAGIPMSQRSARYRAVVVVVVGDADMRSFEGVQKGYIAESCQGAGGFGYDPVFSVDGTRSQAQLSPEEKDLISHRGRACRLAARFIGERAQ
ncbi:MAG TPA: RdgB/HAM1 family non-canonical purine NTP pyrophosphatase [Dehalococcoidia bacterium]|nr:RdgB/HAM1 family non-canonical purine NTP pyrophosphatase [Dehalococcoidia bacterium]